MMVAACNVSLTAETVRTKSHVSALSQCAWRLQDFHTAEMVDFIKRGRNQVLFRACGSALKMRGHISKSCDLTPAIRDYSRYA